MGMPGICRRPRLRTLHQEMFEGIGGYLEARDGAEDDMGAGFLTKRLRRSNYRKHYDGFSSLELLLGGLNACGAEA
jgi:hypothetical protein